MSKLFRFFIYFSFVLNGVIQAEEDKPVIAGYFAEWGVYGRNYHVADIPADKVTHIIYAFAKIANGEVTIFDSYAALDKWYPGDNWEEELRGNFKQLKLLKKKHPHLKTLIAIGGWTLSEPFSDVALTAESRVRFAHSAARFVEKYGFDGIDIDWEYPCGGGLARGREEDKKNFTLLMAEVREQLSILTAKTGQQYLLTVASPAGYQINHYELQAVAQYIDWYHVMTYDFHGAWEQTTNHQAALYPSSLDCSDVRERYTASSAIDQYIAAGVSPRQLVMGVPFYSRGWAGVSSEGMGFFQSAPRAAAGTWEPGVLDYSDVYGKVRNSPNEYVVTRDEEAQAAWVYNPYREEGVFYTFEDCVTLKNKIKFIKERGLRGAMFWEFSGDIRNANDPDSLIHVLSTSSS